MEPVNNNQFEIIPNSKTKRKIPVPCTTAYLNPALDLLANDDPMVNTAMEIVPNKKRKRTRSCEVAAFENTALDIGISKAAVNEFLMRELENVRKTLKTNQSLTDVTTVCTTKITKSQSDTQVNIAETTYDSVNEPIYTNINSDALHKPNSREPIVCDDIPFMDIEDEVLFQNTDVDKSVTIQEEDPLPVNNSDIFDTDLSNITNIQANVTSNVFIHNPPKSNLSLSFIERLALNSPNVSNQSMLYDDDLNESNIMEIKTITIITKKKRVPAKKKNTNPFLTDSPAELSTSENPFLSLEPSNVTELEYEPMAEKPFETQINHENAIMPRRLFDLPDHTVSSVRDSAAYSLEQPEYENVDALRAESPIYENIDHMNLSECDQNYNKQSKILGHDVSQFSAVDILNLNKNSSQASSNDSTDSRNKHTLLNKLSKKVYKTLKKTFKHEKTQNVAVNATLNPYEVPRKLPKPVVVEPKESGIENPCLNLDNSDEIEIEEFDDEEHQYESIKTLRNTRLNMNVTPLRERNSDNDTSSKTNTPGKKVRFDSTLNQEKFITGNSFDCTIQSPGFDAKIDKYQDELENCMNERKFIQQNM